MKCSPLKIRVRIGSSDGSVVSPIGRDAWAFRQLKNADLRGCTPIDHPGPLWSSYRFALLQIFLLVAAGRHVEPLFSGGISLGAVLEG
jgi:hypothetical protein